MYVENCPTVRELWHGTKISFLSKIADYHGLKASTYGRLGPGVYFTETKQAAICIGKNRTKYDGEQNIILKSKVNLGFIKNIGNSSDKEGIYQKEGYDSAQSVHPSWCGSPAFTEFCIKNELKHKIKEVHIFGGEITEKVKLPGVKVFLIGEVKGKELIQAG